MQEVLPNKCMPGTNTFWKKAYMSSVDKDCFAFMFGLFPSVIIRKRESVGWLNSS